MTPTLFATAATVEAVASAQAVAVLIGGYDGSGNYGDIALLEAALDLVERLGPDLVVMPLLERGCLEDHRALVGDGEGRATRAIFFDPSGGFEDDLLPVAAPAGLGFGACYLYGGGYLNRAWGDRKLAMLGAAEELLKAGGADRVHRASSGLQVEAAWVASLAGTDAAALRSFAPLGVRDGGSAAALAALDPAIAAIETGDDAVGVLGPPPASARPDAGDGPLRVNVHIADHDWVSDRPGEVLGFYAGLLAELGRIAGRPLTVQPLIAYLDRRVDERAASERLAGACAAAGAEIAAPLVLRPAGLAAAAPQLGRASLTVSCSYHVALTSLMLEVPAFLLGDNLYYAQKAAGLLADFELPPAFAASADVDPVARAREIAALVLDEERAAPLHRRLAAGAERLRGRRAATETELLRRLGEGAGESGPGRHRLAPPMPADPRHEIADLTRAPGELSFEARIGDRSQRLWIRTETAVTPPADAALASCLMLAMRSGGTLALSDPVSPRLLRNQREYQAIQRAWSLDWNFGYEPLREVEVTAPSRPPAERAGGRVACFFSGGVDSWATLLDSPDVTDLIFVRGFDLIPGATRHAELADEVEGRLREATAELGLELHVVETNLRELSDRVLRWEAYVGSALAAVALFFEPLFERVLIASETDHATQIPVGTSRMIDQLWGTERLEIVDAGGRFNREQRLRRIVDHPVAQRTLRVCWENPGGAYNCGRCRKCLLTMISLEAIGARERIASFPPELDLEPVPDLEVPQPISLALWEDVLETTRATGRADLERAVEPLVAKGKRSLGLPPSYRGRGHGGGAKGMAATLIETERRLAAAEPRAERAEAQLATVLGSRSWRLAAPLRRLGALLRRR